MLRIFLTLVAILIALLINESLWHKKKIKNELARKSIHITVAIFAAFWPYYLSYRKIDLIAIAFIVVVLLSRMFNLFESIKQVKRNTLGDYFFPIGILILALIAPQKEIFAIAFLCVGIGDGMAALIGQKYGRKNSIRILGSSKSIAGSLTVFVSSFIILLLAYYFGSINLESISLIIMPVFVTIIEALSPYGSDDLLIPITVLVILRIL